MVGTAPLQEWMFSERILKKNRNRKKLKTKGEITLTCLKEGYEEELHAESERGSRWEALRGNQINGL